MQQQGRIAYPRDHQRETADAFPGGRTDTAPTTAANALRRGHVEKGNPEPGLLLPAGTFCNFDIAYVGIGEVRQVPTFDTGRAVKVKKIPKL